LTDLDPGSTISTLSISLFDRCQKCYVRTGRDVKGLNEIRAIPLNSAGVWLDMAQDEYLTEAR
jgi:hypothetical protein